jgi:NADP-dependent 3-hydroxy acid dehydrogenase YdfG
MSGIEGRVVAITDASSDIGEATARLLAQCGAHVLLGALTIGRLNALAGEIAESGGSVHYQALDVTRRASLQCFIDEATEVFGRVDVIVSNAAMDGAGSKKPLGVAISPSAVARAVAFAIEQSNFADTIEIVLPPAASFN